MPTYPGTGQSPWGVQLKQYIDDGDARSEAAQTAAEQAVIDAEAARDEAVPAAATASSAASVASGAAASAAASADTAAQAAEDAVAIVIADEDAAVAAMINTPGSDTATALSASTATEFQVQTSFGNGATDPASMTATTAHIQGLTDLANALGVAVRVPYGHFVTNAVIEDVQRMILDDGAIIEAGASGMAAVLRTRIGTRLDGGYVVGNGQVVAGANANLAIHARDFWNFRVAGVQLRGGDVAALKAGDSGANRSAEIVMSGVLIHHDDTIVTGSRGILVENSGDHQFSQVIVNGYDIGVDLGTSGSNVLTDVHVWSDPAKGVTSECFRDYGNANMYMSCHADTPGTYGYHLGAFNSQLIACKTTTPSNSPVADGVVTAIKFEQTDPYAAVYGHHFTAASGKRFAKDIDCASLNTLQIIGLTDNGNIVTKATTTQRLTGLTVRDTLNAAQGFRADAAAPLAGLGLSIRTNGVDRWGLASDGVAESGGNAGSNLLLRRYADNGSLLGTVVSFFRTGTVVWETAHIFTQPIFLASSGPSVRTGNGSPEGVVSAPVGSLYTRRDGGAGTCLYVKESGTGATGWVAK